MRQLVNPENHRKGKIGNEVTTEVQRGVQARLIAFLAAIFGGLATLLADVGLYGVMAYNVGRRTREIGNRMALGTQGTSVMWLVMREVLVLLGAGVAIAIPAAWGLSRLVASQLYGITPNDPLSIFAATATIALVAAFAGYPWLGWEGQST